VFEDADIDTAVEGAMLAKMRNLGEACTAANRFYVHEKVAEAFTEQVQCRHGCPEGGRRAGRRSMSARWSMPIPATRWRPFVEDAVAKGAKLRARRHIAQRQGLLLPADGAFQRAGNRRLRA
jgi:succinate-semialdehyde dehydrogenase/glutarate-semialdehyde dehydrogenase